MAAGMRLAHGSTDAYAKGAVFLHRIVGIEVNRPEVETETTREAQAVVLELQRHGIIVGYRCSLVGYLVAAHYIGVGLDGSVAHATIERNNCDLFWI